MALGESVPETSMDLGTRNAVVLGSGVRRRYCKHDGLGFKPLSLSSGSDDRWPVSANDGRAKIFDYFVVCQFSLRILGSTLNPKNH